MRSYLNTYRNNLFGYKEIVKKNPFLQREEFFSDNELLFEKHKFAISCEFLLKLEFVEQKNKLSVISHGRRIYMFLPKKDSND